MSNKKAKNTICLWFNKDAQDAACFYEATFPNSEVTAVHKAPGDYPNGKADEILTVEFTVCGIPCLGLNGGPQFTHSEAFSFQIATDTQEETDRYWNAIVGNGGEASACGWCKDRWGISWQITPRALTDAFNAGGAEAKRAFTAMMETGKNRRCQNRGCAGCVKRMTLKGVTRVQLLTVQASLAEYPKQALESARVLETHCKCGHQVNGQL